MCTEEWNDYQSQLSISMEAIVAPVKVTNEENTKGSAVVH
jgi:hypothetical protein